MSSEKKQIRTLLITGFSSGIGRAITEQSLADGHCVVGLARNLDKYQPADERFSSYTIDFSDLDALPGALKAIAKKHPEIDGLICCAGEGKFGSLEEFSAAQIRSLMDTNFTSQAFVVKTFLPALKKHDSSDIVLMGSESALSGGRRGAVYCASKFALRGFAQALRDECSRSGVRITVINPGMVKTEFFDKLHFEPGDDESNYILPSDIAAQVAMVLAARPGTVFDEINLSPLKKVISFKPKN